MKKAIKFNNCQVTNSKKNETGKPEHWQKINDEDTEQICGGWGHGVPIGEWGGCEPKI